MKELERQEDLCHHVMVHSIHEELCVYINISTAERQLLSLEEDWGSVGCG